MQGDLDDNIKSVVRMQFAKSCISLMVEAYSDAIKTSRDFKNCNENDITAQLVGFMKNNPMRRNLNISIVREAYLDSEEVLEGQASADESSRIDIQFVVWRSDSEYEYHMEAKNLAEANWTKAPSNVRVDAAALQRRYVRTGINNFVTGKYPAGCLLGYVLQGNMGEIVKKINAILIAQNRGKEQLHSSSLLGIDYHFVSTHTNSIGMLSHFIMKFS